jgi:hypothetical protein
MKAKTKAIDMSLGPWGFARAFRRVVASFGGAFYGAREGLPSGLGRTGAVPFGCCCRLEAPDLKKQKDKYNSRSPSGMTTRKAKAKARAWRLIESLRSHPSQICAMYGAPGERQVQQQIPFGDDNKKSKSKAWAWRLIESLRSYPSQIARWMGTRRKPSTTADPLRG